VLGAWLNVRTNVADLADRGAVEEYLARGRAMADQARELEAAVVAIVEGKL
jgi:formiminotetrahydrofolate cyclodeaminase